MLQEKSPCFQCKYYDKPTPGITKCRCPELVRSGDCNNWPNIYIRITKVKRIGTLSQMWILEKCDFFSPQKGKKSRFSEIGLS